jgi:Activator of Hsp90 ATPase homolog 1-like protein
MADNGTTVRVSIDVTLDALAAFDVFSEELTAALVSIGIRFDSGMNGRLSEADLEVGRVVSWKPGEQILLRWCQADWEPDEVTEVELRMEPTSGGTRVVLEHRQWGRLFNSSDELMGWFASQVAAPLLRTMSPEALGDWLTDRRTRRPSGAQARAFYRDPLYHYPNFKVILAELALAPGDCLIEIGLRRFSEGGIAYRLPRLRC